MQRDRMYMIRFLTPSYTFPWGTPGTLRRWGQNTLHVQSTMELLDSGELAFKGQLKQVTAAKRLSAYVPSTHVLHGRQEPIVGLTLPGGHASHGPPSFPLYPSAHSQLHLDVLSAADFVLSMHCVQVLLEGDENVPGSQITHVSLSTAPGVVEYLPALHGEHV